MYILANFCRTAKREWSLRKKGKNKIILGTQSKARAGWPNPLSLAQATQRADFAVLGVELCSNITQLFSHGWTILLSLIICNVESWTTNKYSNIQVSFWLLHVSFRFHSQRCSEILVFPSICSAVADSARRFVVIGPS